MITQRRWYAVYTKARCEKKVADGFTRRRIENFCPLNRVVRQWSDRKKAISEPLFTSYVFVHATEAEHLAIRQTDGVINLVYWLGNPAVIRDEEIDAIKDFLSEYNDVKLEKVAINVADRVRVTGGVLMHREGNVIEVKNKTVKVFLPSLGYNLIADIAKEKVEILNFKQGVYSSGYLAASAG